MSYEIPEYKNNLKWIKDGLARSPGKKFLMAFTGLFLIIFLLVHLFGNLLLLKNDGGFAFNSYAKTLSDLKILRIIEVMLFLGFIFHITYGLIVTIQNKKARGTGYKMIKSSVTSSFFSRFMAQSGGIVLVFLLIHLNSFFVKHRIIGTDVSMYDSSVEAFKNLPYTLFYVLAMILLSFHLNHGFQSAFQSLGINHNKYSPMIKFTGRLYALLVPLFFALIPIYIYYKG